MNEIKVNKTISKFTELCKQYSLVTYKEQRILRDIYQFIYIETAWKNENEVWNKAETQLKYYLARKVTHDTSDSSNNSKES